MGSKNFEEVALSTPQGKVALSTQLVELWTLRRLLMREVRKIPLEIGYKEIFVVWCKKFHQHDCLQ